MFSPVVRHRPAYAPAQCNSCGVIWYGTGRHFSFDAETETIPADVTLCNACGNKLDMYLYRHHAHLMMRADLETNAAVKASLHRITRQWIVVKTRDRRDRHVYKHVFRWMVNAVEDGWIRPNSHEMYVVHSRHNSVVVVTVLSDPDASIESVSA